MGAFVEKADLDVMPRDEAERLPNGLEGSLCTSMHCTSSAVPLICHTVCRCLVELENLQGELVSLVTYFGEDPKNMKAQDILRIIGNTSKDYQKAGEDIRNKENEEVSLLFASRYFSWS